MTIRPLRGALAAVAATALLLVGCGGGAEADREVAVENLMGVLDVDEDTANCIIDEFGEDRLGEVDNFDPDAEGSDSDAQDAAAAIAACAFGDLDDLGDVTDGADEINCDDVDGPCEYGDDPELDALWDDCEAGDGEACDELFFESPVGSVYEDFGNTCGNRGFEASCAEVYN